MNARSNWPRRGRVLAAATALAATAVAHAAPASGDSVDTGVDVAPGRVVEWCVDLREGDRAQYRFEASAAVDFNIHAHVGERVLYPVRRDGVTAQRAAEFVAPQTQGWCWMWTNRGAAPVGLRYTVAVRRR